MTALIGVASGTAATAAVTGFFSIRTKRLDLESTDKAKLWERISDLESTMRDQAKTHREEVRELQAEIRSLNAALDTKDQEILKLNTDLRVAQLEIQTMRVQLQTGAGQLAPHVTSRQTDSWNPAAIVPPEWPAQSS
jgi:predicted  nucleic acid-binding Zn-ribbon protein